MNSANGKFNHVSNRSMHSTAKKAGHVPNTNLVFDYKNFPASFVIRIMMPSQRIAPAVKF